MNNKIILHNFFSNCPYSSRNILKLYPHKGYPEFSTFKNIQEVSRTILKHFIEDKIIDLNLDRKYKFSDTDNLDNFSIKMYQYIYNKSMYIDTLDTYRYYFKTFWGYNQIPLDIYETIFDKKKLNL